MADDIAPSIPWWQRWLLRCVRRVGSSKTGPRHVAFIMDGNRRFSRQRRGDSSPLEGHRHGARALSVACEACLELGIKYVTVYAFALGNFHRERAEVTGLLQLAEEKFADKAWIDGFFKRLGIRLRFLGDFSYLPPSLMSSLHTAAEETAVACGRPKGQGCKMLLTVCIAYGSRNELARALKLAEVSPRCRTEQEPSEEVPGLWNASHCCDEVLLRDVCGPGTAANLSRKYNVRRKQELSLWTGLQHECVPPPDLLLRTSGERRLSDFLLYEVGTRRLQSAQFEAVTKSLYQPARK